MRSVLKNSGMKGWREHRFIKFNINTMLAFQLSLVFLSLDLKRFKLYPVLSTR